MSATVEELAKRLARAEEQLRRLITRGNVTQAIGDGDGYKVKVRYPTEKGDVESGWLQVTTLKSHADKHCELPDIDEQLLIFNVPGSPSTGYVIGSVYSELNPPPEGAADPDIAMVNRKDGSWWRHDRKSGDLDLHVTGNLTIAVGGDINIGSGGKIAINAADKITQKAPNEITLGDASTININAKTNTNIVGSLFLTLRANVSASLFASAFVNIGTFGIMTIKSIAEFTISTLGNLGMTAAGMAKLSSVGPLELDSQVKASLSSPTKTSVFGGTTAAIGGAATHISGLQMVEQAEQVGAAEPPDQVEPETATAPIPPLAMAAGLPPDTVVEPKPIEPKPYPKAPAANSGGAPDDPGPGEGPTSKPSVRKGGRGTAGGASGSQKKR